MKSYPSVQAYYADVVPTMAPALEALRTQIRALLPEAEEVLAYGIPTFKVGGRSIVHIAAFSYHCSFFPGGVAERYADELEGYKISKGTIQFTPDRPLPHELVERIVRDRLEAERPKMKFPKA